MSVLRTDQKQGTGPSDPGLSMPKSLRVAVQHIRLLQNKRHTLTDALVGAELQFLAALRRECDAGQTTWRELRDAYATLAADMAEIGEHNDVTTGSELGEPRIGR
jgi:hypothetical protein